MSCLKLRQLAEPENPWVAHNVRRVVSQALDGSGGGIQRIIDIPCGRGEYLSQLSMSFPSSALVGADISGEQLASAEKFNGGKVSLVMADARALPFGDCAFDLAFSKDILHHVEDPIGVLKEISRVSKRAVIVEANRPNLSMLMFTKYYKEQHFTLEQLESLIEGAGLKARRVKQFHAYPATFIMRSKNPLIILYDALVMAFLAVVWRFPTLINPIMRLLSLVLKPSFNVVYVENSGVKND